MEKIIKHVFEIKRFEDGHIVVCEHDWCKEYESLQAFMGESYGKLTDHDRMAFLDADKFNLSLSINSESKDVIFKLDPIWPTAVRPLIGLVPLFIWHEQRFNDIKDAMKRYIDADREIPKEWISEYQTLKGWLKK